MVQFSKHIINGFRNAAGADRRFYAYGNYIDEVLALFTTNGVYFPAQDHLYSTTVLFNAGGGVVERYEYDAYGEVTVLSPDYEPRTSSAYANPYTFTGRRLDILDNGSLKIMYYRARSYDPQTGRFMQRDPLGISRFHINNNALSYLPYTDGCNLYAYVRSRPTVMIDAMGLQSCEVDEAIIDGIVQQGGALVEEMANVLIEKGGFALREQFPDTVKTIDIGPKEGDCTSGRIRLKRMVAVMKNITMLKLTSVVPIDGWVGPTPTTTIAHVETTVVNVWICRCPCPPDTKWASVFSSERNNENDVAWDDQSYGDMFYVSTKTYIKGRLDVYNCVETIEGRLIRWICK